MEAPTIEIDFLDPQAIRAWNASETFSSYFIPNPNHWLYAKEKTCIGPLLISVVQEGDNAENRHYRALVRHSYGFCVCRFHQRECNTSWWREKMGLFPTNEQLLPRIERYFVSDAISHKQTGFLLRKIKVSNNNPFGNIAEGWVSTKMDARLNQYLLESDSRLYTLDINFKIGLLYARAGQTTEDALFNNDESEASSDYQDFLQFLGEKIELEGWSGYNGGLDTVSNSTGTYSLFTQWGESAIMFHTCTMLPSTIDGQQLERKRHIGNDTVVLIFRDYGAEMEEINASDFKTQQTHVYIIIHPEYWDNKTFYRISVQTIDDAVPTFGPYIDPLQEYPPNETTRNLLLGKLLNAQVASLQAPSIAHWAANGKERWLRELLQRCCPNPLDQQ